MPDDFDPLDAIARLLVGVYRQAAAGHPVSPVVALPAGELRQGLDVPKDADAATVREALREALGLASGPAAPSFADQVTAALADGGHVEGEDAPCRSAFHVTSGVGVGLGKFWAHAPADAYSDRLRTLAWALGDHDIAVPASALYLFVPEPKPGAGRG